MSFTFFLPEYEASTSAAVLVPSPMDWMRKRGVQPQYPVEIDWSHQLARGLSHVFAPFSVKSDYDWITGGKVENQTLGSANRLGSLGGVGYGRYGGAATNRVNLGNADRTTDAHSGVVVFSVKENGINIAPYHTQGNNGRVNVYYNSGAYAWFKVNTSANIRVPTSGYISTTAPEKERANFFGFSAGPDNFVLNYQGETAEVAGVGIGLISAGSDIPAFGTGGGVAGNTEQVLNLCLEWDRELSKEELDALYRDPYQIFKPVVSAIPLVTTAAATINQVVKQSVWSRPKGKQPKYPVEIDKTNPILSSFTPEAYFLFSRNDYYKNYGAAGGRGETVGNTTQQGLTKPYTDGGTGKEELGTRFDGSSGTTGNAFDTKTKTPYLSASDNYVWGIKYIRNNAVSSNNVIMGNRYGGTASPLQFSKIKEVGTEIAYNGGTSVSLSHTTALGVAIDIVIVKEGDHYTLYEDGKAIWDAYSSNTQDPNPVFIGGDANLGIAEASDITVYHAFHGRGVLSAAQVEKLYRDPYQIFKPVVDYIPLTTSAAAPTPPSYAIGKGWNGAAWTVGAFKIWNGSLYDQPSIPKTAVKKEWNGSAWV